MNMAQRLWWTQAKSDLTAFDLLAREGADSCCVLHYLQMITEKISKAYLWSSNVPPPFSHKAFVQFLRLLTQVHDAEDRKRIAEIFQFGRFDDFQTWIRAVSPLAYEIERLAPAVAGGGPNPEYPWPHDDPQFAPATFPFDLQRAIKNHQGRQLLEFIRTAVNRFPEYADL